MCLFCFHFIFYVCLFCLRSFFFYSYLWDLKAQNSGPILTLLQDHKKRTQGKAQLDQVEAQNSSLGRRPSSIKPAARHTASPGLLPLLAVPRNGPHHRPLPFFFLARATWLTSLVGLFFFSFRATCFPLFCQSGSRPGWMNCCPFPRQVTYCVDLPFLPTWSTRSS